MPKTSSKIKPTLQQRHRANMARAQKKISKEVREVGPLPGICNRWRRAKATASLLAFCLTYFPKTFCLPFSADHERLIETQQRVAESGGQFAFLLPRGSGKTSLTLVAAIWAVLTGRRRFVVLISSDSAKAKQLLESIITQMETNELLLLDFPEAVFPLRQLERIHQRTSGQTLNGKSTAILITSSRLRMPSVENSPASGAIMQATGLLSGLRGMVATTTSGDTIRPDLVLIDDPQTDRSAHSASQCAARERVIASAVLALGGPNTKIAAFCAITQIAANDLAERMLDRKRCPDWQGTRMPMLKSLPKNLTLWDSYNAIRIRGLQEDQGIEEATEFYKQNRDKMDEGAEVSWAYRFNPDELSAVQHSMNLRYRDPNSFASEYQGLPLTYDSKSRDLKFDDILRKATLEPRGLIPNWADHLTAAVDLHDHLAYWTVCCWSQNFRGHVVEWGTYPDQPTVYFSLADARPTLAEVHPGVGREGLIRLSLDAITSMLVKRQWRRQDGQQLRIFPIICDANWGPSTQIVYEFALTPVCQGLFVPGHGRYIGASRQPINAYRTETGEVPGDHWRLRPPKTSGSSRYLVFDSNHWKSFMAERVASATGDIGSLTIAGQRDEIVLIAEHLLAEIRIPTEAQGRKIEEWRLKVNKPDNHYLDTLTMCCVGASMVGAKIFKVAEKAKEVEPGSPLKPQRESVQYMEV